MEKIWLRQYPRGVPAEIDVNEYTSLCEMLARSRERFGPLPAYSNMGVSLTYNEIYQASRAFGAFLQKMLGFRKGARFAIMLPNLLQYPVALFGALRAGLMVVNVNPMYTARELEHQLNDAGAEGILVLENFAHTLQEVLPTVQIKSVITTQVGDLFPEPKALLINLITKYVKKMVPDWHIAGTIKFEATLREGRARTLDDVPVSHDDIAFLQYTGGTTGVAKGAMLTHGNMVANVQSMHAWFGRSLEEGKELAALPLPLYHVAALTAGLAFVKIGAHVVLITDPRNISAFIDVLRKQEFTAIIGVNTLYNALLNAPAFAKVATGNLKLAAAGAMAVQRAVARKWKQVTATPLIEAYGLTEAAGMVISNQMGIEGWAGTAGMPLPSVEAAILNEEGNELPIGEIGEICIRGPQVMKGYWKQPDETAKVFTQDGWLRTGDVGFVDAQGCFKLTERKKDLILVSGFKVFPTEVEDVVMMHPGVLEVAAVGAADPTSGEVVKIVVVRKEPTLSEEALLEHCKKHLTGYKVPKIIKFQVEPLPRSNVGKLLRRSLRESALA
jgi:long-chain acyl-CoA synthetase